LDATKEIPMLEISVFANVEGSYSVYSTIGVSGRIRRNRGAASSPFITGIDRSKIIALGLTRSASTSALAPFSACTQESKPDAAKASQTNFRMNGLSSTTRIVLPGFARLGADDVDISLPLSVGIPVGIVEFVAFQEA
jgi:hypothetical protein